MSRDVVKALEVVEKGIYFLEQFLTAARDVKISLEEVKRIDESLKAGQRPITKDAFMEHLESIDPEFANAISKAVFVKFIAGRLYLEFSDYQTHIYCDFRKWLLEEELSKFYGMKFNIRMKVKKDPDPYQ